jgi:negative regulator of flagellin synthesis FlgM
MSFVGGIGSLQQGINAVTPAEAKPAQSTGTGNPTNETTVSTQTDQTNLSSASSLVTQALEGSDVRLDKVASLQQAIATGTYNVSSSDVADSIIDSLLK